MDIHDNSRIALFLQPGISFLSFDQREYFQDAIDTIHHEFLTQALDKRDSANVAKQDFQKVNFCFPIYAGLQFQLRQDHFVSIGAGYIHDNESVVLVDQNNRSHHYSYTIQGFPLFLEYRFAIPVNLMSLSNESLFSIAFVGTGRSPTPKFTPAGASSPQRLLITAPDSGSASATCCSTGKASTFMATWGTATFRSSPKSSMPISCPTAPKKRPSGTSVESNCKSA